MSASTEPHTATRCEGVPRLELIDVTKKYGDVTAVDHLDLAIGDGEFVTLLGQSGSGKTTALKLIAGFESCDLGSIRLSGVDVATKRPRDRGIGMVFQHYSLFPHMTVESNIAYGLRRRGWSSDARKKRVAEMLELMQLGAYGARYPRQLSGGQQQRVALARAIASEPQLLLMDEPLGALDRALRLDLEQEIRRIHRTTGSTVVYVTHDRDEALALSDRIAVFHEGQLLGLDLPEQLYDRPPTSYVARLLTDANLVDVPASTTWGEDYVDVTLSGRSLRVPSLAQSSANAKISIPRTAIHVEQPSSATTFSASGRILEAVFLGDYLQLWMDVRDLGALVAHVQVDDMAKYDVGMNVEVYLDLRRCVVVS